MDDLNNAGGAATILQAEATGNGEGGVNTQPASGTQDNGENAGAGQNNNIEQVAIPTDKSTPEEWSAFYAKLGRPESADKYGVSLQMDEDGSAAKAFSEAAFAAGLTKKQAEAVAKASDAFNAAKMQAYIKEQEVQMSDLQKDWGADYEKNTEIARQASRKYGLDKEQLVRLENALGSKGLMTFMFNIGKSTMDAEIKTGNSERTGSISSYTREEAIQKMEDLKKDPEFGKKFLAKDKDALKLFNELNHIIAGGR